MGLYDTFQAQQGTQSTGGLYDKFLASSTPQPSLFNKIGSAISNYANESANTVSTLGNAILHPIQTLKSIPDLFTKPLIAGEQKAGDALYGFLNETGVANNTKNLANLISGIAQSAFSPITGLFNIAENTPGLKQVADAINVPFTATGFAGSWSSGKAIDWVPDSILPQASKNIIKQPIQDVTSLAFQTLLGGKIMEKVGAFAKNGEVITPETAQKIVVQSTDEAHKIALSTPNSRLAEYSKSQGYEPITPTNQLPTIDMGAKPKEILPTIQTETPTNKLGDMTVEPIKSPLFEQFKTSETPVKAPVTSETAPESMIIPKVENTPERPVGVTKSASDINQNLVKQGIDALPVDEQSKYSPQVFKEQVPQIANMMDKNIEEVKSMAKGDTPIPNNINSQLLFNAIEAHATKNGDVQLLRDLAKSPLGTKLSEAGQTLGGHGFNDNPNSAVKLIQDVQKAREKVSTPKIKSATVDEIKGEIKKSAPTKQTWSQFIEQIKCNY